MIAEAGEVVWASPGEQLCGSTETSGVGEIVVGCVEDAGVLRELLCLVPFVGEGALED